jgi:hypothetical protein
MSVLRRLLSRSAANASPEAPALPSPTEARPINLVDDDLPTPPPAPADIGIEAHPEPLPWTVARLERILRRANANPADARFQLEARHARHRLSRFWLLVPIDQLESLYAGPIGQVQRLLLHGSLPNQPLAADEERWQQDLSQRLLDDFSVPERLNLLLALMPYCPPGGLRVENAAETLPAWLLGDYASGFDPSLAEKLGQPLGLLDQPPAAAPQASPAPAPLPQISPNGGREGFSLLQQAEVQERMTGLINLHSLDPDDPEVRRELAGLRRTFAQIWLDVAPGQLEELYRNPGIGPLYRSLLQSDFGARPLEEMDGRHRDALLAIALDVGHPAFLQAILAVMPYCPQGKMELGDLAPLLPPWFLREFPRLAGL